MAARSFVNVQGWLVDAIIDEELRRMTGDDPRVSRQVFERLMVVGNDHVRKMEMAMHSHVHDVESVMKHQSDGRIRELETNLRMLQEKNERGGNFVDELQQQNRHLQDRCVALDTSCVTLG